MTFQTRSLAAATVGALFALSGPALAQTPPPPDGQGRSMIPRTMAELPGWTDRLFARLDANQDAAITGDELAVLTRGPAAAMGGGRLRTMVAQSDASNDGRISREELGAGTARMFSRMDANGDGQLSDDELPRRPAPAQPPAIPMPEPEPMPDMSGDGG